MSLASLNSSGIQTSNPALYQTIKDLIDQNIQLQNLFASFGFTLDNNIHQLSLSNALNLLQGQIQFPAVQNSSINPNVLDDYEEGIWTPIDASGAGLVFTYPITAQYIKIGQLVVITGGVLYPVTASGLQMQIGGLPFINQATQYSAPVLYTTLGFFPMGFTNISGKEVTYFNPATGAALTNAVMSTRDFRFSASYRTIS